MKNLPPAKRSRMPYNALDHSESTPGGWIGGLQCLCKRVAALLPNRKTLILTNRSASDGVMLANAFPFRVVQDNWVMVPFGDFLNVGPVRNGRPVYPNGVVQRMDKEASDAMVAEFNSVVAKVGRALFGGRPWQIGHPDQDPATYTDHKAYGWIMNVKTGADGFYMEVQWTPAGEQLKTDGSFKYYSPAWTGDLDKVPMENGKPVVRPDKLLSCGFTNNPNIPVMPLANEASPFQLEEIDRWTPEQREEMWKALANYGTSEGARKGWETRRGNSAGKQKALVKATAKKLAAKGPRAKTVRAVPVGETAKSQDAAHSAGKLERDEKGNSVWRSEGGGKGLNATRSGAYRMDKNGTGYTLKKGDEHIGFGTKTAMYQKAEEHESASRSAAKPPPLPRSTPQVAATAAARNPGLLSRLRSSLKSTW